MQFFVDLASYLEVALARSTALLWCSTDVFEQSFILDSFYTGKTHKYYVSDE